MARVACGLALLLIGLLTMPTTTLYGPQAWTAGTFNVTAFDAGDSNYPDTTYREQVKTVDGAGAAGERVIDSDDYGISAHDEVVTAFDTRGAGTGEGLFYEGHVKFSSAAAADLINDAFPFNVGVGSMARVFWQFRVALTEGKLYIWVRGDNELATSASISADDQWHRLKAQIVPSSDGGFTADGIVRVWLDDVLVLEKTDSFAWVSTTGTPFFADFIAYGHFGILPSTNWTIYYGTDGVEVIDSADICCADGSAPTVAGGGGQGAGAIPVQTPHIGTPLACSGGGTVPTQADLVHSETWWGRA